MAKYKYLLIIVSVIFVVGSTFSVLYFFGASDNKSSIEISSPFVSSSLKPEAIATPTPTATPTITPNPTATPKPSATPKASPTATPDDKQISALEAEINKLKERITDLENTDSNTSLGSLISDKQKEYYVYLGTGSTRKREWVEIPQAAAFIDTNNYGNIKTVSFEAALSITSGEIHARLKNKTNGGIFYGTEIVHNTSTTVWKQSSPFSLSNGYNEYVVEIKSSSDEEARLDGSRIKIVVE